MIVKLSAGKIHHYHKAYCCHEELLLEVKILGFVVMYRPCVGGGIHHYHSEYQQHKHQKKKGEVYLADADIFQIPAFGHKCLEPGLVIGKALLLGCLLLLRLFFLSLGVLLRLLFRHGGSPFFKYFISDYLR